MYSSSCIWTVLEVHPWSVMHEHFLNFWDPVIFPLVLKLHCVYLSVGRHLGGLWLLDAMHCEHLFIRVRWSPTFNPLRSSPESELLNCVVTVSHRVRCLPPEGPPQPCRSSTWWPGRGGQTSPDWELRLPSQASCEASLLPFPCQQGDLGRQMPFLVICILRFALWLCGIIFIEHGRLSIRKPCWGWGVHWRMAQWLRAYCSCWGPQVYSQPTPGSSQLSLTPVLGDLAPSPGLWDYELTAHFPVEHGEEVCSTQVHAREAICIVLQVFLKTLNVGCGDLFLPIQHLGDWGRKIVTSSRPTWTTVWDPISECRKGTKSISPFSTVLSCFPFELSSPPALVRG